MNNARLLCLLFCSIFFSEQVFGQKNLQLNGVLSYPKRLSDIWGYADSLGNEYALVGVYDGFSIVNVTNPAQPVELFFIPGPESVWRDIKVWNKHAYVTNETGGGLLIVNLSNLPATIDTFYYYGPTGVEYSRAHNIFIDEKGFAYLVGFNNITGSILYEDRGAMVLDLKPNPASPVLAGYYSQEYVHDVYVRGDTMWSAEITAGWFAVVNVADRQNPVVMETQNTPDRFAHNCWLSDDGKYLFTTDERPGASVAAFDVSNLSSIKELNRFYSSPGTGVIPHNVFFHQNYLFISYYRDGAVMVDAHRPENLVLAGFYDTSPLSGDGFNGCWGVYPYLPSGILLATDIEEGLFILTPVYKRAAYLEGVIVNQNTNLPVSNVKAEFIGMGQYVRSNIAGEYKTGVVDSGSFDIRFSRDGCQSKIITGVQLTSGQITTLDVLMDCSPIVGMENIAAEKNRFFAAPVVFRNATSIFYELTVKPTEAVILITDQMGQTVERFQPLEPTGTFVFNPGTKQGLFIATLIEGGQKRQFKLIRQ